MYPIEIQKIVDTIPKEYHKSILKIVNLSYDKGANEVLGLVKDLAGVPAKEIPYYCVVHENCLEGG